MIVEQDFFNTIVIVIILNILHGNLELTMASILKTRDKTIKEIKSIIQLKEVNSKSKQSTSQLENAAIATAIEFYGDSSNYPKRKANNNEKC